MNSKAFQIVPAPTISLWVFAVLILFLIGMLIMFARFVYWSKSTTFDISGESLVINGGTYGREIALDELDLDKISIVNVKESPEQGFRIRQNGISIPGYKSGWFKMKTGEKALVFVTDTSRIVKVPTKEDYILMLSVAEPDAFIEALHSK